MVAIPSLNEQFRPDFPLTQEQVAKIDSQHLEQDVAARPDIWFRYLKDSEAYKSTLEGLCAQHEQQHEAETAARADLQQKVYDIQNKLIEALANTPRPLYASRSIKHPDPAMFSGERTELEPFITQLRTKLSLNLDHFETENKKIFYASSRLEGRAMRQVMPHLKDNGTTDYATVDDLISTLTTAFGDPDKKATAQRELRALKQKNTEFSTFLALFQRWAPDSGYEEATLISFLDNSISQELRQASVSMDIPSSLTEYTTILQKLDNRLRAISMNSYTPRVQRNQYVVNPSSTSRTYPYIASQISTPPSTVSRPSSVNDSDSASNFGPMPMDLSNARRGPVPVKEKERRRALGLCSYCGGQGHGAPRCPRFKCFNCGEIGHGIQSCTKARTQRVQEATLGEVDLLEEQGKSSLRAESRPETREEYKDFGSVPDGTGNG